MHFASQVQAETLLSPHWHWPHFAIGELACRCARRFCDVSYWHDPEFLDALEALRADIRRPLVVTSGHRCAQWNAAIGGAPRSQHKRIAVDISLKGHDREALRQAAIKHGFTGIGLAKTFIHLDRRARAARWFYPGSQSLWKIS